MFPDEAIDLIQVLRGTNSLIINGGGQFANLIRKYDEEVSFSKDITHETAIDSMDIIAKLLNDKFDFTEIVDSLEEAIKVSKSGKIPIMQCSDILKENDEIQHSWNLTSDSISAYIANLTKAKLLIATNVDGIYTRKPNSHNSKFMDEIDAKKLLTFNETSVDLMLGELLLKFGMNCFVVNGNFPERVLSLIKDSEYDHDFQYTYIRGEIDEESRM
ncbi:uridylate kinase [Methanobrevibacter cuticularis]|uniref:Uridylate kinase n=1 Tax=Methanobrevibacter cuticularis TaxID=47311 RepID=A0A166DEQ9_9EURY|nr:delta 1-pyrroline-5-carboxylate synthetase [Methanobrevibacter cuticularis]KZX15519.1 uridylate kinase [Methanobrevibacter cuticularis]